MISISDAEFKHLAEYVQSNYGIHLKDEKKYLVIGRLENLLLEKGMQSFDEYYHYLLSDQNGEAVGTLLDRLTTNHTFFMREPEHFDYFRDTILPYLASSRSGSRDLRIWSAGCSSGEEPYTLAMIIADHPSFRNSNWDTSILATDISARALNTARRGIYSREQIAVLPQLWQKKYFLELNDTQRQITAAIRNRVVFRRFNLVNPIFPFKQNFQLILCRNVMIYFDEESKKALLEKFYHITEPGGYLFIGHAESIDRRLSHYQYVLPAIYRKE